MATAEHPIPHLKDIIPPKIRNKIVYYTVLTATVTSLAFGAIQELSQGIPKTINTDPVPITQPLTDAEINEILTNVGYCPRQTEMNSPYEVIPPPPKPSDTLIENIQSGEIFFQCIPTKAG